MIGLLDAVDVLNGRKRAIGDTGASPRRTVVALLATGLDLNLDDLTDVVDGYITFSCHMLDEHKAEREQVTAGCLVDGILLGLILADLRVQEQQRDKQTEGNDSCH